MPATLSPMLRLAGKALPVPVVAAIDPTNNAATDVDTLTPAVDLSISKDDGTTQVHLGQVLTYTITASNPGPNSVLGPLSALPRAVRCRC